MATVARPRIRHPDIVEWFRANRGNLKQLRKERYQIEKGVVAYLKDAAEFIREMRGSKPKEEAKEKDDAEQDSKPKMSGIDQYYRSTDLIRRMKWKRVTWDEEADFDAFERRTLDGDSAFAKIPALSFLCVHLVRDPCAQQVEPAALDSQNVRGIKKGTLTSWYLHEQKYTDASPKPVYRAPPKTRQPPFTVDWQAGSAKILDTASVQELLVFLKSAAPRLQATQERMEDTQTKLAEDLDHTRVWLNVTAIKFNKHDRTFWDDHARKTNPDDYVTPSDVRMFLENASKCGVLLRRHVGGNQIRILPPGKPYRIDPVEKEICIPCNFSEYNFLTLHGRYESLERFLNMIRNTKYLWLLFLIFLIGDLELI